MLQWTIVSKLLIRNLCCTVFMSFFFHGAIIIQVPKFSESGLPSGRALRAKVFSTNAKGRSDTVVLKVYTLKDLAEKRTGELS